MDIGRSDVQRQSSLQAPGVCVVFDRMLFDDISRQSGRCGAVGAARNAEDLVWFKLVVEAARRS